MLLPSSWFLSSTSASLLKETEMAFKEQLTKKEEPEEGN